MDFTRQPIIETIITPKEGFKLVIRSSKNMSQEEHFVDAVQVVSFGSALFFRSTEKPKPFMVPVTDYEILEVREPRMVLKAATQEGTVKIGGGRGREPREQQERRESDRRENERRDDRREQERRDTDRNKEPQAQQPQEGDRENAPYQERQQFESRGDRRRDRRRSMRRRRGGRDDQQQPYEENRPQQEASDEFSEEPMPAPQEGEGKVAEPYVPSTILRAVLPPPTTLIRDDLQRLRETEEYRGAFFIREEEKQDQDDDDSSLEAFAPKAPEYAEKPTEASSQEEEPFLFFESTQGKEQPDAPQDLR